jgi:hypothetical protein
MMSAIPYCLFVIFAYFLVLNLFSAIVVDSVISETIDFSITQEQKDWMEIQEAISVLNPASGVSYFY